MRILVILRRVLDPAGIVAHRRLRRIFVNREVYLIEPADHCAIEAALRIKDTTDAEVILASGRPEPDDDTLRRGLAMGADRAIYLSGSGFEKADDVLVARALQAAIDKVGGVDLVITGATTLDTGQGQLGARLAEALLWPQISRTWSVEVIDERVRAVQEQGDQYMLVEAELPAVVLMVPRSLKPRYPDGTRLIHVYRDEGEMAHALEHWDVSDFLGTADLAPTVVPVGRDFPPERVLGERVEGTPHDMAEVVAGALQERIPGRRLR